MITSSLPLNCLFLVSECVNELMYNECTWKWVVLFYSASTITLIEIRIQLFTFLNWVLEILKVI